MYSSVNCNSNLKKVTCFYGCILFILNSSNLYINFNNIYKQVSYAVLPQTDINMKYIRCCKMYISWNEYWNLRVPKCYRKSVLHLLKYTANNVRSNGQSLPQNCPVYSNLSKYVARHWFVSKYISNQVNYSNVNHA